MKTLQILDKAFCTVQSAKILIGEAKSTEKIHITASRSRYSVQKKVCVNSFWLVKVFKYKLFQLALP